MGIFFLGCLLASVSEITMWVVKHVFILKCNILNDTCFCSVLGRLTLLVSGCEHLFEIENEAIIHCPIELFHIRYVVVNGCNYNNHK